MMDISDQIKEQIENNKIIIYIKGTPQLPQCGFSARAVELLQSCAAKFAFVNILAHPDIRETLPKVANWPTFPQLYIGGELIGGCDIMIQLYKQGQLQQLLASA